MKKRQLEQLNYVFSHDIKENVFLYINGLKSTIEIENLFLKVSKREEFLIKGWSIIQKFDEMKEFLKNENIDIDFKNENGDTLTFESSAPFWQLNDKEIDVEDYNSLINKIKELNDEAKKAESSVNGPGSALPGSVIFDNEKYEKLLTRLKKENFQDLRFQNYVLFLDSESHEDDLIIEVTEEGYNLLQILNNDDSKFLVKDPINEKEINFEVIVDDINGENRLVLLNDEKEIQIKNVEDKDDELGM